MSDALPRAFGAPVLRADMRTAPEDFLVEEIAGFEPSGEGEHLLLTVEKRGMTTAFAAKRIATWAGLPEHAIGYAGLKDRHAVTRQRFSVHLPKREAPDAAGLHSDDLKVLDATWHSRKLPRGALAGNRFVLQLRNVQGETGAIDARLRQIAAQGLPNWFGEQRFGRDGGNVAAALAMFGGRRVGREQRSLLLSAARSELFNRVLAARIADGNWNRGLEGEVWMLSGSRSVFGPEPWNEELAARLAAFDIHPSGPLWGEGELRSTAAAAAIELAALAGDDALALRRGLEQARLKQERRALRLAPQGLRWEWPEPARLTLSFALPPGSYATALLHELGETSDVSAAAYRSSENR
ncbi:tRNA pseudouridine(13) synthase TruD [Pseudoxanthomonas wuyuanensis]|uniref:tRNA pseudouridine synthase D n=1 Tax=Pseudoxanthomonas wuyuanensis TaxID=1073196 RepID=A0A286DE38_9GAMM|nr:tRNA pseudouridine(13) synthase TruD [Pseudoxanthomonas wuyuanensis]KAF1720039.1 tRNA pseudouridine(13) synthase TruD [Pseudoxanthomonas wuyuanensis]SOD56938.1 tRNA pseudouridine13 synthase [Pseudoxanthomonas wuyuanensis]